MTPVRGTEQTASAFYQERRVLCSSRTSSAALNFAEFQALLQSAAPSFHSHQSHTATYRYTHPDCAWNEPLSSSKPVLLQWELWTLLQISSALLLPSTTSSLRLWLYSAPVFASLYLISVFVLGWAAKATRLYFCYFWRRPGVIFFRENFPVLPELWFVLAWPEY